MDMQDKELDKLFQSSLDGLEIEPSAHVWGEIAGKLDAAKRKRSILPFLSIAAGILLLFTAGLLFIPKMVKVNHVDHVKIAKNETPAKLTPFVKSTPATVVAYQQNKRVVKSVIAPVGCLAVLKNNDRHAKGANSINKQDAVMERSAEEPELALATYADNLADKPGDSSTAAATPVNSLLHGNNLQQIAVQSLPQGKPKARPVKKHRIRSLGDVFNVVIAAVDKREDKIIEFSNTDEDDATITGLNLGIIKVKKEK